jgi:hypothetical protein
VGDRLGVGRGGPTSVALLALGLCTMVAVSCARSPEPSPSAARAQSGARRQNRISAIGPGRRRPLLTGPVTDSAVLAIALGEATEQLLGRPPTVTETLGFARTFHIAELDARRRQGDGLPATPPTPAAAAHQFLVQERGPEIAAHRRPEPPTTTAMSTPHAAVPSPVRPSRPLPPLIPQAPTTTTTTTT